MIKKLKFTITNLCPKFQDPAKVDPKKLLKDMGYSRIRLDMVCGMKLTEEICNVIDKYLNIQTQKKGGKNG